MTHENNDTDNLELKIMQANAVQSEAIISMRKDIQYLIQLTEKWNTKTDQMRESYNGRFAMEHADIKGVIEKQIELELKQKEFEPTHTFVTDLKGKIVTGFIALLLLLGSLIYGGVELLRRKVG